MIDSGSEVNLIPVDKLQGIGLSTTKINSSQRYNIKSSTQTVEDCILGEIDILMQNNIDKISNFCRTTETFLVATKEIKLEKIIFGTPFLKKHNIKLHFNQSGCKISGSFKTEQGSSKINLKTNFGKKQFA